MEEIFLEDLVENFSKYLGSNYPGNLDNFQRLKNNNREAACAEAVIFSYLSANGLKPVVNESTSTGGVDYLACGNGNKFLAEVTCLQSDAVSQRSGLSEDPQASGCFSFITDLLRQKATDKSKQLSNQGNMPRVLFICCCHTHATALMGPPNAEELMNGGTKISVPLFSTGDKSQLVTELEESVFFRFKKNSGRISDIESCRQSISALVLTTIHGTACNMVGLLHPEPAIPFQVSVLPDIPFLKVKKWPVEKGIIEKEWTTNNPTAIRWGFLLIN